VAIAEPHALFDPTSLKTTAVRTPSGYRLNGVKSLVPAAADAEIFIVGAQLSGKPVLFIVESSTRGGVGHRRSQHGDSRPPRWAGVELDNVSVPLSARLGEEDVPAADSAENYLEAIALARLGWAALAVGTAHAVLDNVVPYIKERQAFGEPVAHRQAVAFMTANIAIELDGLRLINLARRVARRAGSAVRPRGGAGQAARHGQGHANRPRRRTAARRHGYTKEHPVERWYRDLRAIGVAEGVVVISGVVI